MIRATLIFLSLMMMAARVPAAQAQTVEQRLAALPNSMLGVGKSYRDGNTSITLYWGKEGVEPMIGVWVSNWQDKETWGGIRDGTRETLGPAKLTKVIRESDFQSERFPGLHGFFGEYETQLGSRQVWIIFADGVLLKVNAAYFDAKDHDRVYREVESKLFGKLTLADNPDTNRVLNAGAK